MNSAIKPLSVALFGDCDTCSFSCNQLNLVDSCSIQFQLGVMVPQAAPAPRREIDAKKGVVVTVQDPTPAPQFSASPVSGQINVTGKEFEQLQKDGYSYDTVQTIITNNVPSIVFLPNGGNAAAKAKK